MKIEVDQSGKIEQTDMDTVIAFSNNHQYAVLLPKELKRSLINKYRKEKQIILKLFVICVYYTIKDYLHQLRGFAKPQKMLSEKDIEKMIQGALTSKPASTMFSAKLRHGSAWHPSSTLLNIITYYINFSFQNENV